MKAAEIKAALVKRGSDWTMSKIGERLGVSPTAVHLVIERKSISRRIMRAVADAVEKPETEVFPEYFGGDK